MKNFININYVNSSTKMRFGIAIQIVSVFWGLKHLLAYALSNFDAK